MKPPKCQICSKDTILADAGILSSITYFYCRHCKVEVDAAGWETPLKDVFSEPFLFESFEFLGDPGDDNSFINPNFLPNLY